MHPNEPKLIQSTTNNQLTMTPEFDELKAEAVTQLGLAHLETLRAQAERQLADLVP